MSTLSSIIEKIQKLRRLATSSNVNEAAAAAAAADRLIQEHGLEEAQLEADGQTAGEMASLEAEPVASWTGLTPAWQLSLGSLLAHHYDCACFRERNVYGKSRKVESLRIVGRPSDVATMRYMFAWLTLEIERLAHGSRAAAGASPAETVAIRNSFRHGAVHGVIYAMRESKRAARATATSAAIVLVDSRLAASEAALKHAEPGLVSAAKVGGASRGDAYRDGVKAGRDLHGRDKASLSSNGARQLPRAT